jgi:hypothetical protein
MAWRPADFVDPALRGLLSLKGWCCFATSILNMFGMVVYGLRTDRPLHPDESGLPPQGLYLNTGSLRYGNTHPQGR